MRFQNGHRLGPYEIVASLGAGGMGEVYRARDTRLGRDVAIKVLPDSLRADPDAYARFEREARAVAALSHPNIMAIHDFGEHDGTAYAAVELLEGETLREALVPGPLPQRKAVDYARQTARGLGAAHDRGVVHRDLKPENLFVTRDGRVKILDFGLARTATDRAAGATDDTPTHTHLTGPGTVLGTVNYMSPEQARGEIAGPASDIFSLGSVLYEMLGGKRAFERDTVPETMTAILRDDPPDMPLDAAISAGVQRIVQRCLEKRPEERFQSAHDLAFALETSSGISTGVHPVVEPAAAKPKRLAWWPVAAALAVGLVAGALFFGEARTPSSAFAPVKTSPITFSGYDENPAASPDGRTIAFASRRAGAPGIWVKQLQGGGEAPLTRGEDSFPRFSPDGTNVLFLRMSGGTTAVYRTALIGGEPRKLIDDAVEADWSPDGSRVVYVRLAGSDSSIRIVNADGSGDRVLADLPGNVVSSPRWSPDGKTIAYRSTLSNNNIVKFVKLVDVETGAIRDLLPERPCLSGLTWSGDGKHLVFSWSEDLLAGLASTSARMSIQDVASGVTEDLFWTRDTLLLQTGTRLDLAGPGKLVFSTINTAQSLREVPLRGRAERRTLTSGSSVDRQPVYAPDGETILFSSNRGGNLDLWTINTRTGAVRQLTDDEARDWDPAYTADGSRILWSSDRGGNLEIWIANADGSGARQVSSDGVGAENPGATPDGEWIVYMTSNPDKAGMWKIRGDGSDATQLYAGAAFIPEFSPDGRYIAFNVTTGANTNSMMIMDLESGETTRFGDLARSGSYVTSANGRARWFADGGKIAFIAEEDGQVGVMVQDFVPGRDTTATRRKLAGFEPEWVVETFDISPDDGRVVLSRIRPGGTVMLAENVPHVSPPRRD
jgi:Tol biopolymer transport system component